ncbi:MAG: DUF4349 domain-containing protein [Oscillospiraceae bacterium]|nr:DUF4349 domain-containing protein [Oscillospiraceae bacterium]
MKIRHFFAIFLCICLLLTACGAEAPADKEAAHDIRYDRIESPMEDASTELKTDSAAGLTAPAQSDRKLIRTVSMDAETENYDALITALEEKLTALGGYTESRQTGTYGSTRRWSSMTIRIPADNLSAFVTHVSKNANVLSTSEETKDVTLQYVDTESKITALETEQARLLELLAGAQNLSEILEIEARLSDVTYELERYASQKRSYDNQITYATVRLTVEEVEVLTPVEEPSVFDRIRTGFTSSLRGVSDGLVNLFVLLVAGSPYLLVYGAVIGAILAISSRIRKRKQKKESPADPETP